jgi:NADPH-dependent ferric siderophore reductase
MAGLERFPRRAGVATLVERRSLTPRMIRVTLRAEDFGERWPIEQPGEILTLLFVPPGEPIVLPELGWRFPAGAPEQEWRNYTVRRHDRDACEIEVDVVLHQPRGPACTWAERAPIGADVGYAGPRVDYRPRDDAEWLLLCGDETALPAIAAILEQPPPVERVLALVEVGGPEEEQELALPPGASLRWLHRDDAPPATTTHLADALREVELPAGRGQAWGAAESHVARDVREVLRGERGMPPRLARAKGYWLRKGDWIIDEHEDE